MALPAGCPIVLQDGMQLIDDPDEEIMELYMARPSEIESRGISALGNLKSHGSVVHVDFELRAAETQATRDINETVSLGRKQKKDAERDRKTKLAAGKETKEVSVKLHQDLHALNHDQGDTGSVLWRSSLHFARHILQQHHFPPHQDPMLFDPQRLALSSVLELGCGTGLLAILLSPFCQSYTASDMLVNLRLCSRNLSLNNIDVSETKGRGVVLEEVDWFDTSAGDDSQTSDIGYDMILAVDCVFNEALAKPLVNTMGRYCQRGSNTVAIVISELRSHEVILTFLETWIDAGWSIARLPSSSIGLWDGRPGNWAGWVGHRK